MSSKIAIVPGNKSSPKVETRPALKVKTTPSTKSLSSVKPVNPPPKMTVTASLNGSKPHPLGSEGMRKEFMGTAKETNSKLRNADQWMTKHNPYLSSLRDPLSCPGARIPDSNLQPTTTLQVICHTSVTMINGESPTDAFGGVLIGCSGVVGTKGPYLIPQTGVTCPIGGFAVNGAFGLLTGTGGSSTIPFDESPVAGVGSTPFAIPNLAPFLDSYCNMVRVVSIGLSLRNTGNVVSNKGYFVCNSLPGQYFKSISVNNLSSITNTMYQNFPGAVIKPAVGNGDWGLECTYNPADPRCMQFGVPSYTTSGPAPLDDANYQLNPGILYAYQVGGTAGDVLLVDIVINYEVVVNSGNIAFGVRPAYEDPLALATAANARANDRYVSEPTMFDADESTLSNSMQSFSHPKMLLMNTFSGKHEGFLARTAIHGFASPVRLNLSRNRKKRSVNVQSAQVVPEKPMFESLLDGFLKVAEKVAPMLLSLL